MSRVLAVDALKGTHAGQTAWIVGKGPSIRYLKRADFGEGPVITINDSVAKVQLMEIENKIYSLQKDGYPENMVRPGAGVTLILQYPYYSDGWFADHEPTLYVDPVGELGFQEATVMSIRMTIALAKIMGCTSINLMCCDSFFGDMATYDVIRDKLEGGSSGIYAAVIPLVRNDLEGVPHNFITPKKESDD